MTNEAGGLNETELSLELTHSKGFPKLVRFDYFDEDGSKNVLMIAPKSPVDKSCLTRQKIYFLEDIECQIKAWFPDPLEPNDSETWFKKTNKDFYRIADNCLFEYSLRYPNCRLSTRVSTRIAGKQEMNFRREWIIRESQNTRLLLLDGHKTGLELNTGDDDYERRIENFINIYTHSKKKLPSSVHLLAPYYTYDEIELLSNIYISHEDLNRWDGIEIFRGLAYNSEWQSMIAEFPDNRWPDQDFLDVKREYHPLLLDFYFAGLSSLSPMIEYKNYYNILEYFFDGKLNEYEQLSKVLNDFFPETAPIDEFINSLSEKDRAHFLSYEEYIGDSRVRPLLLGHKLILVRTADRIYQFRNAVFHSKKLHKGKTTHNFTPFSEDETIIQKEILLLKWIAQEIIKQTHPDDLTL